MNQPTTIHLPLPITTPSPSNTPETTPKITLNHLTTIALQHNPTIALEHPWITPAGLLVSIKTTDSEQHHLLKNASPTLFWKWSLADDKTAVFLTAKAHSVPEPCQLMSDIMIYHSHNDIWAALWEALSNHVSHAGGFDKLTAAGFLSCVSQSWQDNALALANISDVIAAISSYVPSFKQQFTAVDIGDSPLQIRYKELFEYMTMAQFCEGCLAAYRKNQVQPLSRTSTKDQCEGILQRNVLPKLREQGVSFKKP